MSSSPASEHMRVHTLINLESCHGARLLWIDSYVRFRILLNRIFADMMFLIGDVNIIVNSRAHRKHHSTIMKLTKVWAPLRLWSMDGHMISVDGCQSPTLPVKPRTLKALRIWFKHRDKHKRIIKRFIAKASSAGRTMAVAASFYRDETWIIGPCWDDSGYMKTMFIKWHNGNRARISIIGDQIHSTTVDAAPNPRAAGGIFGLYERFCGSPNVLKCFY